MHAHEIIGFHAAEEMFGNQADGFSLGKVREPDYDTGAAALPSVPEDGYMVGGVAPEIVIPRDERLVTAAVEYLARTHEGLIKSGQAYVGGWVNEDTGMVHVDVSEQYHTQNMAEAVGRARGELAVWDVANAAEVRLL